MVDTSLEVLIKEILNIAFLALTHPDDPRAFLQTALRDRFCPIYVGGPEFNVQYQRMSRRRASTGDYD